MQRVVTQSTSQGATCIGQRLEADHGGTHQEGDTILAGVPHPFFPLTLDNF